MDFTKTPKSLIEVRLVHWCLMLPSEALYRVSSNYLNNNSIYWSIYFNI